MIRLIRIAAIYIFALFALALLIVHIAPDQPRPYQRPAPRTVYVTQCAAGQVTGLAPVLPPPGPGGTNITFTVLPHA